MSSVERETVEEAPLFQAKTEAKLVQLVIDHLRATRPPVDELVVVVARLANGTHRAQIGARSSLLSHLRERGGPVVEVEREFASPATGDRLMVYEVDEQAGTWAIDWMKGLGPILGGVR